MVMNLIILIPAIQDRLYFLYPQLTQIGQPKVQLFPNVFSTTTNMLKALVEEGRKKQNLNDNPALDNTVETLYNQWGNAQSLQARCIETAAEKVTTRSTQHITEAVQYHAQTDPNVLHIAIDEKVAMWARASELAGQVVNGFSNLFLATKDNGPDLPNVIIALNNSVNNYMQFLNSHEYQTILLNSSNILSQVPAGIFS